MSKLRNALLSGLAGAITLNLIHESARRLIPHAPRVDVIGERAVVRTAQQVGLQPPRGRALYWTALAGDLLVNTLHFAKVARAGPRSTSYGRGLLVGLWGAGSALILPRVLSLGQQPNQKEPLTPLLTMAWYGMGGIVAAAVYRQLEGHAG